MDKLNMKVKDGAIKLAIIFRIFAGIPSIPVAFEILRFCQGAYIESGETRSHRADRCVMRKWTGASVI